MKKGKTTYSFSLVSLSVALVASGIVAIDVAPSPIFGVGLMNAIPFKK